MWTARLLVLASLFAPAALGEFGSSEPVRLCLYPCDVCRCGRKNTPLVFCDLRSLRLYHNFLFLLFRCQSLSDKCDESL